MNNIQALREKRKDLTNKVKALLDETKEQPKLTAVQEQLYQRHLEDVKNVDRDMQKIYDFQQTLLS
ncbi:MAG: hypothetical protein JRG71_11935, partial [Deltaproteobacteria bacterium]|nr:hypothetical protein [Deltaproteobacteria bacterium]